MPGPSTSLSLLRLAWLFYLLLAIAGVVWLGLEQGIIPGTFFMPETWPADLGAGLAAGLGLVGLWMAGRRILPAARELEERVSELLGPMAPADAVALALISGFAEELFFRGAMQAAWGWIPATAIFTLLHTGPGRPYRAWTLFAAAAGLTFAGLMAWRGTLLAPAVAHVLVNGVNLLRIARRGAE